MATRKFVFTFDFMAANLAKLIINRIRKLPLIFLAIFVMNSTVYPQASGKTPQFKQQLSWQEDKNVYEYKVEIQSVISGTSSENSTLSEPLTLTTSSSSISFSLPVGKYKYKIYAYDFLGRQASESDWQTFEILKAVQPQIKVSSQKLKADSNARKSGKANKNFVLEADVKGVTANSKVTLKNSQTGKVIEGKINLQSGSGKTDNVGTANNITFPKIDELGEEINQGEWILQITNPSGLTDTSEPFELAFEAPEPEKTEKLEEKKPESVELAKTEEPVKKNDDYYGADFHIIFGATALYNTTEDLLFGQSNADSSDGHKSKFFPYAKISYLPFKTKTHSWKLGFSFTAESQNLTGNFTKHEEYKKSEVSLNLFMADVVLHRKLIKDKLYLALTGGMGLALAKKEIEVDLTNFGGNSYNSSEDFGFYIYNGGASLFWIAKKGLAIESGGNYIYSTTNKGDFISINPFVGLGLRF